MTGELQDFLRRRRSIRRFRPDPVPAEVLQRILETAIFAPSAHNRQPWRFAVLADTSAKARLANAMAVDFRRDLERDGLPEAEIAARIDRTRRRTIEAPVVIVLCMDASDMDVYPDPQRAQAERTMAVQSVALAGLQLLLAVHAEGLGGVWTCGPLFTPGTVRSELDLPAEWEPQAMLLIGYAAEMPKEKTLRPLEEVVRFVV